jgi:hypothetical protein
MSAIRATKTITITTPVKLVKAKLTSTLLTKILKPKLTSKDSTRATLILK